MTDEPEPFFSTDEWKALAIVRPREWRGCWGALPFAIKALTVIVAVALGFSIYELFAGETDVGLLLLSLVVAPYVALAMLFALAQVIAAAVRWLLRKMGVLEGWRRVRDHVFAVGKFLLWAGFVVLALIAFWPFLSVEPAKTWYALLHEVPAKRIDLEKKPQDCAFTTAPLGGKHCHYEANVRMLNARESSSHEKSLVVTYVRVDD